MITTQPATLTYTNSAVNPIPSNVYVLKNSSNTNVSNTLTPISINTTFSTNIGSYSSNSSYTLVHSNGYIYTSMINSAVPGNGCIQITNSSGVSSLYLQFNNGATSPIPSNYSSPQYPTGLAVDTSGFLYFLVYGDNNVYKINDINNPSTTFVLYAAPSLSAPYDMDFDSNNNLYISSTNPPWTVGKVTSAGSVSVLTTLTGPSYGVAVDNNNNLYIGLNGGVILKYDLTTNILYNPFYTISGQSEVYGIAYNSYTNSLFVNTISTNIYSISLTTNTISLLINGSTIIGGLGVDPITTTILYGTTDTTIKKIQLPSNYIFTNLVLNSYGNNYLTVNNITANSIIATINVNNINPLTSFKYLSQDLGRLFKPNILGTTIGYDTNYKLGGTDLRQIFASISSGSSLGYNVNYIVTPYGDLSAIFAKAT
jgi:hypothetical protein